MVFDLLTYPLTPRPCGTSTGGWNAARSTGGRSSPSCVTRGLPHDPGGRRATARSVPLDRGPDGIGNCAVTSLELDRLATLYARDIRELLADDFVEEDALVAFFRAHPDVHEHEHLVESLRGCVALGREVTNLEHLLGIDRDLGAVAVYPLPKPPNRWQAIQHGERVASEERQRLRLGIVPIANLAEVLETQGVRTALVDLPEDVSGLTLSQPRVGLFVVANRHHHVLRRRFSYAHEYAHVLLDLGDRLGLIQPGPQTVTNSSRCEQTPLPQASSCPRRVSGSS